MSGTTAAQQLLLEYINDLRLDPTGDTARYITSYAPLSSTDPDVQTALNYFNVSGSALQAAVSGLTSAAPLAWNANLAASAAAHDGAMISTDTQAHQVSGETDFASRITASGYTGWSVIGENIFAYATGALDAHAAFVVDWGTDANGMQDPAGHRDNLMDPTYKEVGVALADVSDPSKTVGPEVVTEEFGARTSDTFVLGVAYDDANQDGFYSLGEGVGGLTVSVGGASDVTGDSGGYTVETALHGAHTVTLSGGDLAGPVYVELDLEGVNAKLDVVDGHILHTSASAAVVGPVDVVQGIGVNGLALATGDGAQTLIGTVGADTLIGGAGNDTLIGGGGDDTAVFSGAASHYSFAAQGDGSVVVTGDDGVDRAVGIDHFVFSDALYDVSSTGAVTFDHALAPSTPPVVTTGDGGVDLGGSGGGGFDLGAGAASATLPAAVHAVSDFSGDGSSDLLWRNTGSGVFTVWDVTGVGGADQVQENVYGDGSVGVDWKLEGTFDFNGDGAADLLWRNSQSGLFTVWDAQGQGFTPNSYLDGSVGTDWKLAGLADFNGDGKADLLWRNANSGMFTEWTSTGTGFTPNTYVDGSVDPSWKVAAVADFDGDGKADILWRADSGMFTEWRSNGAGFDENVVMDGSVGPDWRLAATGDFDGDGKADLLWRNVNSGMFTEWRSTGTGFTPNVYVDGSVDPSWKLAEVADFNGDGKADLLWRHDGDGTFTIWQSTGTGFTPNVYLDGSVSADWTVATHAYGIV